MENDLSNAEAGSSNPAQVNIKRQQVMAKWLGTPVKFRDPSSGSGSNKGDIDSRSVKGHVTL